MPMVDLEKSTREHGPYRLGKPSSIVASDFSVPEVSGDDLTRRRDLAEFERSLVLGAIPGERVFRWEFRVVEQHVDLPPNRFAHLADGMAGGKVRHASP